MKLIVVLASVGFSAVVSGAFDEGPPPPRPPPERLDVEDHPPIQDHSPILIPPTDEDEKAAALWEPRGK